MLLFFFFYKLIVYCCWRNPDLWIDDWVDIMEFTKVRRNKGLIRLDKWKNLGS
jgi:hypothetical protein